MTASLATTMQAPPIRSAGVLLPAFSARRRGDLGIGDTLALHEWTDWAAAHQVGFLQLLPINENGADESPYGAISSVALDPIYLAFEPDWIPGLNVDDLALASDGLGAAIDAELVDYAAVRRTKRGLLELVWKRWPEANAALRSEFAEFCEAEADWLEDYRLFRWLMEEHGEHLPWDQWPASCHTPEAAREYLEHRRMRDRETIDRHLEFHGFVQWLCFRQWRALRDHADASGVKLMGDVPIGVAWHSCDVFFERDLFHFDWCGGTPPEHMFEHDRFLQQWGQNWGIPLYRWDAMAADGYAWWRRRIRRHTGIFRMFRLDHILGFYRIYAFPWRPERNGEFIGLDLAGAAAINEGRLPRWFMRPDDTPENKAANLRDGEPRLQAVVEAAAGAEIIAEDLGWVPDYVGPHLARLRIAGFHIPHWNCDGYGHPLPGDRFPECSFATYSTHDHDPLGALWNGCRLAASDRGDAGAAGALRTLSEFGRIPLPAGNNWPAYGDCIQWSLFKALFDSRSRYAVLMVTELFNRETRINSPGTTGGSNWRFRLKVSPAEMKQVGDKLASIIGASRRG